MGAHEPRPHVFVCGKCAIRTCTWELECLADPVPPFQEGLHFFVCANLRIVPKTVQNEDCFVFDVQLFRAYFDIFAFLSHSLMLFPFLPPLIPLLLIFSVSLSFSPTQGDYRERPSAHKLLEELSRR